MWYSDTGVYFSVEDLCIVTFKDMNGVCYHYLNPSNVMSTEQIEYRSTHTDGGAIEVSNSLSILETGKSLRDAPNSETPETGTREIDTTGNKGYSVFDLVGKAAEVVGNKIVGQVVGHVSKGETSLNGEETDAVDAPLVSSLARMAIWGSTVLGIELTDDPSVIIGGKDVEDPRRPTRNYIVDVTNRIFPFLGKHAYVSQDPVVLRYQPIFLDSGLADDIDRLTDKLRKLDDGKEGEDDGELYVITNRLLRDAVVSYMEILKENTRVTGGSYAENIWIRVLPPKIKIGIQATHIRGLHLAIATDVIRGMFFGRSVLDAHTTSPTVDTPE
jgi:hypothetical protein